MSENFIQHVKTGFMLLFTLTLLTGLIYPVAVTAVAQLIFPWKANGSLIEKNGEIIGSVLLGQSFVAEKYFWSRPSATPLFPYNAENSAGSNLSLSKLKINKNLPLDLATASGSGLDPDISPAAAFYQIERIAHARKLPAIFIEELVKKSIRERSFKILGEARVNVLLLNLALDDLQQSRKMTP